jgi:DNA-binding CsgD family transcriptional regulator
MSGAQFEAATWLDRALETGTGNEPWYDAARCIRSFVFALDGDISWALGLFGDLPERSAMVPAARTVALAFRGVTRLWAGDLQAAAEDLTLAVNRINAGLQVRFPCRPLAFLAETEFRLGHWDDARGHAEQAVALARGADRDYDLAFVHSAAVPVAACRGDWAAADGHAEVVEQAARTFGGFAAILAASARGILGLARDDPEEALRGAALALAVPQIDHYDGPAVLWWRPVQVWALIRTGDLSQAEVTLTALESRIGRGAHGALIHTAWLRGSLAIARGDLGQADQVLQAGRRASRNQPMPFHRGLLELEHGRCLSRLQRRKAAITVLRAAHEIFSLLGARPFLQASEAELTAVGLRPRTGGVPGVPGLTGQELRVVRLVVAGLSNREAAAQLYLSPKTVEYHLTHAFTKLGVRSRHQLTAHILGRESSRAPA